MARYIIKESILAGKDNIPTLVLESDTVAENKFIFSINPNRIRIVKEGYGFILNDKYVRIKFRFKVTHEHYANTFNYEGDCNVDVHRVSDIRGSFSEAEVEIHNYTKPNDIDDEILKTILAEIIYQLLKTNNDFGSKDNQSTILTKFCIDTGSYLIDMFNQYIKKRGEDTDVDAT